jgi:hypothetical protein
MKLFKLLGIFAFVISSYTFSAPTTLIVKDVSFPLAGSWETIELLDSGIVLRDDAGYVAIRSINDDEVLTLPDGSELTFKSVVIKFVTNQKASKAEEELFEGVFNYEPIFQDDQFTLYIDKNNKLPDFINAYLITQEDNLIEITGNISQEKLLDIIN